MINIQDRIFIQIKIDGSPLVGANLCQSITLAEGTPIIAPSMKMVLNDHSGYLSKELALTDGNEILITVGKSPNDLKTVSRQYRVFKVKQVTAQAGPTLEILGIYDAPAWTTESARDSFSGTTSQVLKSLADKCKLDYDGPQDFNGRNTADNQIWVCVGKSRGAFAQQEVARHAYMDDHSAMYAALTSLGVLKYRNIMDVIGTTPDKVKYVFAHNILSSDMDNNKQVYAVQQAVERSDAGLLNIWQNYGAVQINDGPSGVTKVQDKVDVKTSAPFLAINDQVAKTVGKSKISYGPIDCGNVHDKYYEADYINRRQLALFSERMSILITEPTEVQLFDPVIYKQADRDPARPVRATDIYMVTGKTVFVAGGAHYAERIELSRMSITEKGGAELKSSEPTSARESSIPDTLVDPSATVAANTIGRSNIIGGLIAPVENMLRNVRSKAGDVLNNVSLTVPSLTNISTNIQRYSQYPDLARRDIQGAINSVNQLKNTYDSFARDFSSAAAAVRQGNVNMLAQSVSGVARTAAFFRPDGIAENISAMLGVSQVMSTTAQLYNSISQELAPLRGALDEAVGIAGDIDNFTGSIASVVNSYQSQMSSTASSFNSMVQNVTGETPNLSTPNMELNRFYLQDMLRGSIQPVTTPLTEISYQLPDVAAVQKDMVGRLRVKDDTRNYQWAPETGYTLEKISASDMLAKVQALNKDITNATRQMDDFNYDKSTS
jgi:hypothetical protein